MNSLIRALKKVVAFLDKSEYQYMIIGGLAVSLFSKPRQTFDIDIKIVLSDSELETFIVNISEHGKVLPEKPKNFVNETGVLPVEIDGVRVDFILAMLDFEFQAIHRSKSQNISGVEVLVTTAEDLIIQKCVSTRESDWLDIKAIISQQYLILDKKYLMQHVIELSDFMPSPEIKTKIESYLNEFKV